MPIALGAWNLAQLLGEIAARDATIEQQQREIEQLRERVEGQSELLAKTQQVLLELRAKLFNARQEMFGASRERMNEWQLDIFDQEHESPLPPQAPDLSIPVQGHQRKRRGKGRPALPDDLPRERVVHAMSEQELAQYDRATVIGQTVTRTLKYTPAKISVIEHACLRYALVKDGVSTVRGVSFQASPLIKSNASPELLARIIVAHFDSGMPFYRLEEEFAMHGLHLSRNTMSDWTIRLSKLVLRLYEAFRAQLLSAPVIFGDDTPFPQLCKQLDRTRTVRLWGYASAGAVFQNGQWVSAPKVVYYDYTASRAGCHPMALLSHYEGYLQADDYSGWAALFRGGKIQHVACHAHARRMFYKIYRQLRKESPQTARESVAAQALAWIRKLYDIERKLHDADPSERRRVRQQESAPLLHDYQLWLQARAGEVLPKSGLGRAIAYTLSNWAALTCYLDDGNLAMDSNLIERAIRRVAIARKNHLFFGSEAGGKAAAVFYSILATCRANDVNPYEYLVDVLGRINDHPVNRIEELAPYNWKPSGTSGSTASRDSTSSLPVAGSATRH
ncbi:IS66 family transposase [Caballeronia calidae]|uniref:IS66 family transposase n=1 Tax=Caballeronia calidae TaxID=1777139 RepID=UPI00078805B1|nr:IS66 family transposase [Caballeronia calidae]